MKKEKIERKKRNEGRSSWSSMCIAEWGQSSIVCPHFMVFLLFYPPLVTLIYAILWLNSLAPLPLSPRAARVSPVSAREKSVFCGFDGK